MLKVVAALSPSYAVVLYASYELVMRAAEFLYSGMVRVFFVVSSSALMLAIA